MAIGNAFNRSGGTGTGGVGGSSDGTIKEVTFTDQTSLTITHDFETVSYTHLTLPTSYAV